MATGDELGGSPWERCQFTSVREYTSAELGRLGNRYRQKGVWMLCLWDSCAKGIVLTGRNLWVHAGELG